MLEDIRGIFHNPLKQVSSARRDTNFFAPFLKVLKFEIHFLMYLFINLNFEIDFSEVSNTFVSSRHRDTNFFPPFFKVSTFEIYLSKFGNLFVQIWKVFN